MCDKSSINLLYRFRYRALLLSLLMLFASTAKANQINWQPCEERPDSLFECATVYVPVNHQQGYAEYASGEMIGIALARLPARDGESEKGSLFLNPGGPGESGVNFVFDMGLELYNREVGNSYDIIGFDPRGVARSEQFTCFEDFSELLPVIQRPFFPLSDDEITQFRAVDESISSLCASRAGNLINHMSTADVARDLDLLRKAVGDKKLNFAGFSYGSYIGATYANLFPRKVGAMVLDSVIDPVARATGRGWQSYFLPAAVRQKNAVGAQDTLEDFFRVCDEVGVEVCPFAGNSASRYAAIADRLRNGAPVDFMLPLPDGSSIPMTYQVLVVFTEFILRDTNAWPALAGTLAALEAAAGSSDIVLGEAVMQPMQSFFSASETAVDEMPAIPQPLVATLAVECADSNNPPLYEYWPWAADYADYKQGYLGPFWAWTSSTCHSWAGSQASRYAGNFRTRTKNPVLIVHTFLDPTTPYSGAKKLNRLLRKSRLLTINGWGHTTLFTSECATQAVSDYLVEGKLPKKGAVCDQDFTPFGGSLPLPENSKSVLIDKNKAQHRKKQRRKALRYMRSANR